MEKKYEFTSEVKGSLKRIHALRDFGDVNKGDLGGFIEKEANLSHKGNCWVDGDAKVYENAKVCGNAQISGLAEIRGNVVIGKTESKVSWVGYVINFFKRLRG